MLAIFKQTSGRGVPLTQALGPMNSLWPLLFLCLTGCATTSPVDYSSCTENILVTGYPELPRDARAVAERLASCHHFAGEFTGGESVERDAEVTASLAGLRCATIEAEAVSIRSKYKQDVAVQAALTQAACL